MNIYMAASSSKGNSYMLVCDNSSLMLEAGIAVAKAREKLRLPLSTVAALLITHEHGDHAGFAKQYAAAGIPIWASKGTCAAIQCGNPLNGNSVKNIKGWKIRPFDVKHDAVQPLGYLINAPDGTRVVFATDTYMIPYKFPRVNYWMVECNYDDETLDAAIRAKDVHPVQAKRVVESHMSLAHLNEFFSAQDLSVTKGIYLLHGSSRNLDTERAIKEIRSITGKPVYCLQAYERVEG